MNWKGVYRHTQRRMWSSSCVLLQPPRSTTLRRHRRPPNPVVVFTGLVPAPDPPTRRQTLADERSRWRTLVDARGRQDHDTAATTDTTATHANATRAPDTPRHAARCERIKRWTCVPGWSCVTVAQLLNSSLMWVMWWEAPQWWNAGALRHGIANIPCGTVSGRHSGRETASRTVRSCLCEI